MNESEAILTSIAISTAMFNDDKPTRELLYETLEIEELKRVLRWTVRMSIHRHLAICALTGEDPIQAWQEHSLAIATGTEGKGEA